MGNALTCFEKGLWDVHPEIKEAYSPAKSAVYQDMSQPLSHYFISSGHNSYLTGDQLLAPAGTSTIIACLKAGCRVVELDVYNGSTEPECKHGGTLTKPVSFRACIEAVRDHGFTSSAYPVIVTLENHTTPEKQAVLADILRSVLGERLYVPDPSDPMGEYLSPEKLVNRVLVRASLKKEPHEEFKKLVYIKNTKFTTFGESIKAVKAASSSFAEHKLPKVDELGKDDADEAAEYERTRSGLSSGRQSGSGKAKGTEPEDAVIDVPEGSMQELYTYTSMHLMRVYPGGWRVRSDNYNPMAAWVRGASLAALNWQNWAKPMWINEGKFMDNGGSGYVLKPEWMRRPDAALPVRPGRTLRVTVHSAFMSQGRNCCIFKDDIFVELDLYGMPVDREEQNSDSVANSGRLVVGRDFDFVVRFPEMAVLVVQLMDEDTGTSNKVAKKSASCLGYYSLPLSTLREGDFKLVMRQPGSGRPMTHHNTAWVKVTLKWLGEDKPNPMYSGPQA